MSASRLLLWLIVVIYSLTLMAIEVRTSQDYVRHFFTDIEGPVFFYAINTSLSTTSLWLTALLFAVSIVCLDPQQRRHDYWFYWSQVVIFTYLGLDDRFLFHETLGEWLKFNDAYLILGLGLVEIGLLMGWGNLPQRSLTTRRYLYSGAFFFAIMVVIDAKLPARMLLRLSLEDLTKFWACLCLTCFAWEVLIQEINHLKSEQSNR